MSGGIDRRSARTKKALKRAMLELLSKKEISKITVSELTELADIGRGTFYLHYADPYDLLDKMEDETLYQITAHTEPVMEWWDYDSLLIYLEDIWQYIYENMNTFQILMNRWNGMRFMEKFKRYCKNTALAAIRQDIYPGSEDYYGAVYVISGTLGIFQLWMEEGAPILPDQLAQIMRNLIVGPSAAERAHGETAG